MLLHELLEHILLLLLFTVHRLISLIHNQIKFPRFQTWLEVPKPSAVDHTSFSRQSDEYLRQDQTVSCSPVQPEIEPTRFNISTKTEDQESLDLAGVDFRVSSHHALPPLHPVNFF